MALGLSIFGNNVLPAFLIMAVGVIVDRQLHVDKRTLSRVAIYILTPCLVFTSIVESEVDSSAFGMMILYVILLTIIMGLIGLVVGRLLGWPERSVNALVLSISLVNAGNLGLSIILFTFGEAGFSLAAVYFMTTTLMTNTFGAFFAARGKGGARDALLKVLKLPGIYAFVLALILRNAPPLPDVIMRPVGVIAGAQIPIMLMMLGVQLSQTRIGRRYGQVALGVFLRLVVGAVVAVGLAAVMGLQGLTRQVAVAESATPTAVTAALLAVEFEADADYVASVVFFSTLLSSVSISVLLSLMTG